MSLSSEWWAKETLKRHKQRLKESRPMIDDSEPVTWKMRPKASAKYKKCIINIIKIVTNKRIDYENRVLLERILTCPSYIPPAQSDPNPIFRPVPSRVNEISKINDENVVYLLYY